MMAARWALGAVAALALGACSNSSGGGRSDAGVPSNGGAAGFGSGGVGGGGVAAASGGVTSASGGSIAGGTPGVAGAAGNVGGTAGASGAAGSTGTPVVNCMDGGEIASWPPLDDRPQDFNGPALLSQTGLYDDTATGVLAKDVQQYTPLASLWADGATKRRWIKLPAGGVIDTTDMDDWVFPVDTKLFKEFTTRDGKRIETRMIWKRGKDDIQMVSYIWNPEQTEAAAAPEGQRDASCTTHDVPDVTMCPTCHAGRTDKLLGPTALQLSHPVDPTNYPGINIGDLMTQGKLSNPPAAPLKLPGDAPTQAALAYLHANCGNCHNPKTPDADRLFSVYFWQRTDSLATLEDTVTYKSLVTGRSSPLWIDAVLDRMHRRKDIYQMPTIATEERDDDGIGKVKVLMDALRTKVPALPPPGKGGSCPMPDAVWQLFSPSTPSTTACTGSFCHSGGAGGFYLSNESDLVNNAVSVPAAGPGCGTVGLNRIEPGEPMRSLLYLKLLPAPPCGTSMPPTLLQSQGLTAEQLKVVYDWIASCKPGP